MTKVIDRRTARTRKTLHDALMTLILRKGYEAITVQDIIDEADVGRSTFYSHYTGKQDLLRSGFKTLRAELTEAQRAAGARLERSDGEPLGFSLAMFEHACSNKQIYRALAGGRGGAIAVNEIRRILSDVVGKELPDGEKEHAVPREIRIQFVVGAFVTILTWSLERSPRLTPSQMDAMFRRLVLKGIGSSNGAATGQVRAH